MCVSGHLFRARGVCPGRVARGASILLTNLAEGVVWWGGVRVVRVCSIDEAVCTCILQHGAARCEARSS